MQRPFSDDDIDRLIATPYVPPKPLTIPGILLLIMFFPVGIYYLIRKNTPEYMLSLCETDEERDALFAYLKTPPYPALPVHIHMPLHTTYTRTSRHERYKKHSIDDRFVIETLPYRAAHGFRY
jgi:hypothetical protein